jgi:hypothetical protein
VELGIIFYRQKHGGIGYPTANRQPFHITMLPKADAVLFYENGSLASDRGVLT